MNTAYKIVFLVREKAGTIKRVFFSACSMDNALDTIVLYAPENAVFAEVIDTLTGKVVFDWETKEFE